jgi:hypothetical protein
MYLPCTIPEQRRSPVSMSSDEIPARHQQFAFAPLPHPHMTLSNATPFNRNVHRRGFCPKQLPPVWHLPYRATPKVPPSSFAQHGAVRGFMTQRRLFDLLCDCGNGPSTRTWLGYGPDLPAPAAFGPKSSVCVETQALSRTNALLRLSS